MIGLGLLALGGGVLIGLARALNGRLGMSGGAPYASVWNHAVGFLFMSALLLLRREAPWSAIEDVDGLWFVGGAIGALYVTANSFVVPRLGATLSTLLVLSAQLLASVGLDAAVRGQFQVGWTWWLGLALVVGGMKLSLPRPHKRVFSESSRG